MQISVYKISMKKNKTKTIIEISPQILEFIDTWLFSFHVVANLLSASPAQLNWTSSLGKRFVCWSDCVGNLSVDWECWNLGSLKYKTDMLLHIVLCLKMRESFSFIPNQMSYKKPEIFCHCKSMEAVIAAIKKCSRTGWII